MKAAAVTVTTVGVLATIAALASSPTVAAPTRVACGSEFWSLKTLSDPQRALVRLRPVETTVASIDNRPMPVPTPVTRNNGYERHVWRVRAHITEFKLEADDDIHLILSEQGHSMIAEMPAAVCLPATTRDRAAIAAVRAHFTTRCGIPETSWKPVGAVASISGVGFWDFPHGQSGAAPNYAELHPVTGLRILAGC